MKKIYKNFKRGVSNLIYYFRTIWNDRPWDFMFIEYILLKKYERMYEHMTSDNCMASVDQDEYNKALRICINILKRRKSDFYIEIWDIHCGQYLDNKWIEIEGEENLREYVSSLKPGYNPNYTYENGKKPFTDQIEERDLKIYFKLIEKYHLHWWD